MGGQQPQTQPGQGHSHSFCSGERAAFRGCLCQGSHTSAGLLSQSPGEVAVAGSYSSSCPPGSQGDPGLHSMFSVPQGTCEATCGPGLVPSLETREAASRKEACVCTSVCPSASQSHQRGSVLPLTPGLGREKPVAVTGWLLTGIQQRGGDSANFGAALGPLAVLLCGPRPGSPLGLPCTEPDSGLCDGRLT